MKITATIEVTLEEVTNFVKKMRGLPSEEVKVSVNVKAPASTAASAPKTTRKSRGHKKTTKIVEDPRKGTGNKAPKSFKKWTPSQESWLLDAMEGLGSSQVSQVLLDRFNKRFGTNRSRKSLTMKISDLRGERDKYKGRYYKKR